MAHPIQQDEKLSAAISRMARHDLREAVERVSNGDLPLADRIHDVRTAIKKVRAIARMVRPHHALASREERRLRKIARAVSPVRDAEVALHTFDELARQHAVGDGEGHALRRMRGDFAMGLHRAMDRLEARGGLERIGQRLARARRRARRWAPHSDGWRTLGPGLVQGYARAQAAMTEAYAKMTGQAFHAWRRATKYHRHQIHAVRELAPAVLQPRLAQLDRLGDWLGDEHDLTVFGVVLRRDGTGNAATSTLLRNDIDGRRAQMRAQARDLGEQLFSEDAQAFESRMRAAFRSFRRAARRH